jgi:hypothetical protein
MKMILNGLKNKIQEVAYQKCLKMKDQENSIIKEGKREQYWYIQEMKKGVIRKVGLDPRLVCAKKMAHDMFNMPMIDSRHVWPLEQLQCLQKLAKLKAIKHRYHVWKDCSKKNNEWIAKWNARAREMHKKKIHSRAIVTKQGVLEDL